MKLPVRVTEALTVYAGDDFEKYLLLQDPSGMPLDLSTWKGIKGQWRPTATSTEYVPFKIYIDRAKCGLLKLALSAKATRAMRSGVWDIQGEHDGKVKTLLYGRLEWSQDVTRVET